VRESDESRARTDSRTESEVARLRAEVARLDGERAGALDQADGAGRREAEARARAVDADYVAQQLRGMSEERDELQVRLGGMGCVFLAHNTRLTCAPLLCLLPPCRGLSASVRAPEALLAPSRPSALTDEGPAVFPAPVAGSAARIRARARGRAR
jgi:hypothetical protein